MGRVLKGRLRELGAFSFRFATRRVHFLSTLPQVGCIFFPPDMGNVVLEPAQEELLCQLVEAGRHQRQRGGMHEQWKTTEEPLVRDFKEKPCEP